MALVERFELGRLVDPRPQQPVAATMQAVNVNGTDFIQLDGYGSANKQLKGHRSQNVRLSRTAALQLRTLIDQTFG